MKRSVIKSVDIGASTATIKSSIVKCKCGKRWFNALEPNEQRKYGVLFMQKCPSCERMYLFKKNQLDDDTDISLVGEVIKSVGNEE